MTTADRPIVIVGCARSGTTLLQAMVHSHARLAMPPENRFVMPVYRNRATFGDLREAANRDAVADAVVARRAGKFADLRLDADAVRRRMHEVPPTIGSLLGAVLEAYARRFGRQRWGDKRPNYIKSLDDVLALFPDAQIVHMIRDGRDCVASLKRMPWWTSGTRPRSTSGHGRSTLGCGHAGPTATHASRTRPAWRTDGVVRRPTRRTPPTWRTATTSRSPPCSPPASAASPASAGWATSWTAAGHPTVTGRRCRRRPVASRRTEGRPSVHQRWWTTGAIRSR